MSMKIPELRDKVKVGQYWLVPGDNTPARIENIEGGIIYFNNAYVSPVVLGSGFTFLWYTCELYVTLFTEATKENPPKPGEIWVNDLSQDIFFIHPDQTGCGEDMFRVISDSSNIKGLASLFKDIR